MSKRLIDEFTIIERGRSCWLTQRRPDVPEIRASFEYPPEAYLSGGV